MIEIIPDELISATKEKEVIAFLQTLAVPPRLKKEAYISWCKVVGIRFTRSKIVDLLGAEIDQV